MYHEITYHQAMRRRLRRVIYALLAVVIAVNLVIAVLLSQQIAQNQGVTTLRDSILDAAVQCCAVEGSYPSSLSHLENDYGLVVNHDDYVVTYEWLGDNVPPSVVVRQR